MPMCAQVMEGFFETLERIAILFKVRTMAEDDPTIAEMWGRRKLMIEANPSKQATLENYPAYPTSDDSDVKQFCSAANEQLAMYRGKKGVFARSWIMDIAKAMPAYLWWDQNGGSVPELQAFARMILTQPASASIRERINSEFEFVKDRRRNRLSHEKANKLVGLFHNLRLLKRMKKPQYSEPVIAWTEGLDKSGVTTYQLGSGSVPPLLRLEKSSASPVATSSLLR